MRETRTILEPLLKELGMERWLLLCEPSQIVKTILKAHPFINNAYVTSKGILVEAIIPKGYIEYLGKLLGAFTIVKGARVEELFTNKLLISQK